MLSLTEFALLVCVPATTALIAIVAGCCQSSLWRTSIGVVATSTWIGLHLLRIYARVPSSFDSLGDGFELAPEFAFGGFLGLANLGLTFSIIFSVIEKIVERKKAAGKTEGER